MLRSACTDDRPADGSSAAASPGMYGAHVGHHGSEVRRGFELGAREVSLLLGLGDCFGPEVRDQISVAVRSRLAGLRGCERRERAFRLYIEFAPYPQCFIKASIKKLICIAISAVCVYSSG
jgi:hypothetical protein